MLRLQDPTHQNIFALAGACVCKCKGALVLLWPEVFVDVCVCVCVVCVSVYYVYISCTWCAFAMPILRVLSKANTHQDNFSVGQGGPVYVHFFESISACRQSHAADDFRTDRYLSLEKVRYRKKGLEFASRPGPSRNRKFDNLPASLWNTGQQEIEEELKWTIFMDVFLYNRAKASMSIKPLLLWIIASFINILLKIRKCE